MHFAHPSFLLVAFAAGVVLVGLFVHLAFARRRALAQLGAAHLLSRLTASISPARRRLKEAMVVTGVVLVAIALARPQLGYRFEEAHRRGVDLLFAVDTSRSMLTPDVKPSRLERAKLAVRDLVEKFPEDRVGLVAFAGSAFLETPLTLDHAIFEQSLEGLDTHVIPLGGTNVGSAIDTAAAALADDEHKKVLVLLTDGEDLSGEALAAADAAAKKGVVVYTVGVGTPRGELIPVANHGGATEFVKDTEGHFVTSKLDESLLRRIATATGGSYRPLGDNGQGLASLYTEELAMLPRSDLAARSQRVPIERYQWPLGFGLLLLGVEPLLGERRRRPVVMRAKAPVPPRRFVGRLASASAAALVVSVFAPHAWASPQSAERAYHDGRFAKAQADYAAAAKDAPGDPKLGFNVGAAAYRNGDIDAATKAFESALHTDDLKLQEHGYYDLGDALYRGGERALKDGQKERTITAWKTAVSDYEAALHLDAKDADAIYNRDFVKRRLDELEKQQEQEKQQQQRQQQQKDDKKDSKSSKDSKGGGKGTSEKPSPGEQNAKSDSHGDGSNKGEAQGAPSNPGSPPGQAPSPQANGQNPPAKPDESKSGQAQGTPQAGTPQPAQPPDDRAESEGPSRPGELSKSEARALLDSLRGELQVKPSAPTPVENATQDQPRKDW